MTDTVGDRLQFQQTLVPLPPRTEEMRLATAEMLRHYVEPYDLQDVPLIPDMVETFTLGLSELTGGQYGSQVIHLKDDGPGQTDPSPWHMHHVDAHFSFVLRGSISIEMEGVGEITVEPGKLFAQPVRNRHRELAAEPGTVAFEITSPARYKTTFFIYNESTKQYEDFEYWMG
jgi:mannose-6-phosphate isomerase-like protein (cupin superfamily)